MKVVPIGFMKLSKITNLLLTAVFFAVFLYIPNNLAQKYFEIGSVTAAFNQSMTLQGKLLDKDNLNISDGFYSFKTELFDAPVDGNSLGSCEYKFVASVNSISSNTSVIYESDSDESTLKEGMLLWNSTDTNFAVITEINTTTNTIVLDRSVDTGDYSWGNGDSITSKIRSDDGRLSIKIVDLESLTFNTPDIFVEVTMDADGNGSLEETFKPRKQFDATVYVQQAKYADDSATRYFDRDSGTLTMRNVGDDLKLKDDTENLIIGSDSDFNINYDSSDDQLEITDGSNLMAAIKSDGSVGNFLNTGDLSFDRAGIFNENGGSFDFRVEGDSDSNLLFVDASLNRVGIGLGTGSGAGAEVPESVLQVGSASSRGDITFYGDEVIRGSTNWQALTNINSVFVYDTSTDDDGGAWRQNSNAKASSWYNEELDDLDGSCNNFLTVTTGDDRCGSRAFPERAVLVATDSALYIFDAKDNSGWMRFDSSSSASDIALGVGLDVVTALNGNIYIGANNAGTNDGLIQVKYKEDTAYHYYQSSGRRKYASSILNRNNAEGWQSYDSNFALLVNGHPNDISAAVISGNEYFAVATDAGSCVINETDGLVFDITPYSTSKHGLIKISKTGSLYVARKESNALLVWNKIPTSDVSYSTRDENYDTESTPALPGGDKITSIDVTTGYQGKQNLVALGMGSLGFSVLRENQGDPSNGSIKYYTKDYVSELLVGDIRGAWSFNGTEGGTIADGSSISDVSTNTNDLISEDGSDSSMEYESGIRGTGIGFDGEDDYLRQKNYEEETLYNYEDTHSSNFADGEAFARVVGLDLSPYASASNDYMLVQKDSSDYDIAWGYIDTVGTGETLGSEMVTNGNMETGDPPSSWPIYNVTADGVADERTGGTGSQSLELTATANSGHAYLFLDSIIDEGSLYKINGWVKNVSGSGGCVVQTYLDEDPWSQYSYFSTTSSTWVETTKYFSVPINTTNLTFELKVNSSGDVCRFDDFSIKKVTETLTDGVHIVSSKGGSTRNWAGISSNFDTDDGTMIFEVRKSDFQISDRLSLGAWVKLDNTTDRYTILQKNLSESGFYLDVIAGGVVRMNVNPDNAYRDSANALSAGVWHHVVGVYDATRLDVYIDGTLSNGTLTGTIPSQISDDHINLSVGATRSSDGSYLRYLPGSIDEPFITAEALTSAQIKSMYQVGKMALLSHDTDGDGSADDSTLQQLLGTSNQVNSVVANGSTLYVGSNDGVSVMSLLSDSLIDSYRASNKSDDNDTAFQSDVISAISTSGSIDYANNGAQQDQTYNATLAIATSTGLWIENSDMSVYDALAELTSQNLVKAGLTVTESFRVEGNNSDLRFSTSGTSSTPEISSNQASSAAFEVTNTGDVRGYAFGQTGSYNILSNASMEIDGDSDDLADNWSSNSLSANSISDENDSGSAKYGRYSQSITANASDDYLYQQIGDYESFKESWITASVWVKGGASGSIIRLSVYDGVDTTSADILSTTNWQRIWLNHLVNTSASQLSIRIYPAVNGSGSALVDAAMLQGGQVLTAFSLGYSDIATLSSDLIPPVDDTYNLGSSELTWNSLYLGDGDGIYFGNDEDISIASDGEDQLTLGDGSNSFLTITSNLDGSANFQQAGSGAVYFRDSDTGINSSVDGQLDINASAQLDINTPELTLDSASGTTFQMANGSGLSFSDTSSNLYLDLDDTADSEKIQVGNLTNRADSIVYGDQSMNGVIDQIELSETNVTEAFVYDTAKDTDGGSWRNSSNAKASSWYNETVGDSDRGSLREFPQTVYIISTGVDTSVQIYNSQDDSLWMQFDTGGSDFSDTTGLVVDPYDIYARNGKLYIGGSTNGLMIINFIEDKIYQIDSGDSRIFNGNLSQRNSQIGYSDWEAYTISDSQVNGISINRIDDQEYIVAATDSGISVINLTLKDFFTLADNATDDYGAVWLSGDGTLYASNLTLDQLEKWINVDTLYSDDTSGTPDYVWDESSTPALWPSSPSLIDNGSSLLVIESSSLVNQESSTIYLGHDDGVSVINDNFGNENASAVKYLSTSYISELLVGDIRGAWSFNGTEGSTISNGSTITDISIKTNDATTADGSDSSMEYVHGVRGTAVDLDGDDDYISIADSTDFEFASGESFTMGLWYKANIPDVLDGEGLITKGFHDTSPSYPAYWLIIDPDEVFEYGSRDGSGSNWVELEGSGFITDGDWHQLVVVRDCSQGETRMYENGELTATASDSCYAVGVNGDPLVLMWQYDRSSEGSMDEVFISGDVLSSDLIEMMYEVGVRSLRSHDSDGDASADDSTLQQLAGAENDSYSLSSDDSHNSIFIASGNSDGGAVTVLGSNSDTQMDSYIEDAGRVERDGTTAFDISNLTGVSVSGNYASGYGSKFNLLISGYDDAGTSTVWMESRDLSIIDVLGLLSGSTLTKNTIQSNSLIIGSSELQVDVDNPQSFQDNVFEANSSNNRINIGNSINPVTFDVYGDVTIKGDSVIQEIPDINDVYIYDTTGNSDGGAWRKDSRAIGSSWYNETLDNSGEGSCDFANMDRCGSKYFPKLAILVGTEDNLYIFDGTTKELWMKFSEGGTGNSNRNMIGIESSEILSVYALNGTVYLGGKAGVYPIYFKQDKSFKPWDPETAYAGNIAQRNDGLGENND